MRYVLGDGQDHEFIKRSGQKEIPYNQYRGLPGNRENEKHIDCLFALCELGMER